MTPAQARAWRKRLGFTQATAAAAVGITLRMWQYYEAGGRTDPPRPVTIPKTMRLAMAAVEAGLVDPDERTAP